MSATEPLFSCGFGLLRGLAGLSLAALCAAATAQTPTITDADMARARQAQPAVTEQQIEAARRRHGAIAVPDPAAVPSTPDIDALPQPAARDAIDLEALARGYAKQGDAIAAAQGLSQGPSLFVFISLSMPQPTLHRLLDQAARARASVLLRGLAEGSLRRTVAQVQSLIGSRALAVRIDPQAFDRFAVVRVPSFVLVKGGARAQSCASGSCAAPEDFVRVAGDVSLDYALEHMRGAAPALRGDAEPFLARLRTKP